MARNCEAAVKCSECDSDKHPTALHPDAPQRPKSPQPPVDHGGESQEGQEEAVVSSCTEVCGQVFTGKSCSKICLVKVYPASDSSKSKRIYAMLDDQSNVSLARSEFFEMFQVHSTAAPYTLQTCSGIGLTAGRRASGYVIESIDGALAIPLPTLIECNMIPNKREEIPTAAAASGHRHLDVCLGSTHRPPQVTTLKTHVLTNGRPTHFPPCENHFNVEADTSVSRGQLTNMKSNTQNESMGNNVFCQTKNDNKLAPSMEDLLFLEIMDKECFQDETQSWVALLPFRQPRAQLPNNRQYAISRLKSLERTLNKNPETKAHL